MRPRGVLHRVEKLVLLANVPTVQFGKADMRQKMASSYFFLFNCPWLPERLLAMADFGFLLPGCFVKPPSDMQRRSVPEEEIEHYKNAIAMPGALTGALNYYRWGGARLQRTVCTDQRPWGMCAHAAWSLGAAYLLSCT